MIEWGNPDSGGGNGISEGGEPTVTRRKHEALVRLGQIMSGNADLVYLLGFLTGRLHRVHFVRDLSDAPVALRFAAGRRRVWPGMPFQGVIHGVPIPAPGMIVSALLESDEDICIRVDAQEVAETEWFDDIVLPSYASLAGTGTTMAERAAALRAKIDHGLDIYRACRDLLATSEPGREAEVRFFLNMAEHEIENLSRQLQAVQSDHQGQDPTGR